MSKPKINMGRSAGQIIKQIRLRVGYSQSRAAREMGISLRRWQKIEASENLTEDTITLALLALNYGYQIRPLKLTPLPNPLPEHITE